MSKRLEAFAQRTNWGRDIEIAIVGNRDDGNVDLARPLVFERQEIGLTYEPTMKLRPDAAQQLMDELWRCGLRPSEGTGSAGSLAATERHLNDMQKIAFQLLGEMK